MNKLNRKGFTLVELLAVIVILAIVVGITLVTVLPTLKQSREKAFQLTADTAADYFQKQYELYVTGYTSTLTSTQIDKVVTMDETMITNAGLKKANYTISECKFKVNTSTGRVCVQLKRATGSGTDYYDAAGSAGEGITLSNGCGGVKLTS